MIGQSYYKEFIKRGKPRYEFLNDLAIHDLNYLQVSKDTILSVLLSKKISAEEVNSIVYICLEKKEYSKAVEWSHILNIFQIGNSDYIDTMGEAYYNAGSLEIAQQISNQLVKLKPEFINQFKVWEENKK